MTVPSEFAQNRRADTWPIQMVMPARPAAGEISLRTKGRVYQAVVRSILLYGCVTWPVRVADERMLEVFDNDSIRCILRVRCRDRVPSVELRRHLSLTSIPALLAQRRLR